MMYDCYLKDWWRSSHWNINANESLDRGRKSAPERTHCRAQDLWLFGNSKSRVLSSNANTQKNNHRVPPPGSLVDAGPGRNPARAGHLPCLAQGRAELFPGWQIREGRCISPDGFSQDRSTLSFTGPPGDGRPLHGWNHDTDWVCPSIPVLESFPFYGLAFRHSKKIHFAETCDRWCAQVQNDCKNVYSLEYADLKGSLAEDLRNRELNYPIVLALDTPGGKDAERALESPASRNIRRAMRVIQSRKVRALCAAEMQRSSNGVEEWLQLWNRKEKMNLQQ